VSRLGVEAPDGAAVTDRRRLPDQDWTRWSRRCTVLAEALTGRLDLTVVVDPHAAPGLFDRRRSRIELGGALVGPNTLDERSAAPPVVLRGVLAHEIGHAVHSRWRPYMLGVALTEAMAVLEEIRVEHRLVTAFPERASWLRAAARQLIEEPLRDLADDRWSAAVIATLTEGRVAAGSLEARDVARLSGRLRSALDDGYDLLHALWLGVFGVADDDGGAMLHAAGIFCDIARVDPFGLPERGTGNGSLASAARVLLNRASRLARAGAPARRRAAADRDPTALPAQPDDELVAILLGRQVRWHERAPTAAERTIRRGLAAVLIAMTERAITTSRVDSAIPPGRLRGGGAVREAAERELGLVATAAPWRRVTRARSEEARLRVAVLIDVSSSMAICGEAPSSALWIISSATRDAGGASVGIAFGEQPAIVYPPSTTCALVRHCDVHASFECIAGGLELAESVVELGRDGTISLVVVISDGTWVDPGQAGPARTHLERLQSRGVHVAHIGVRSTPDEQVSTTRHTIERTEDLVGLFAALDGDGGRSARLRSR